MSRRRGLLYRRALNDVVHKSGTLLAARYRIERPLGQGGMGVVYQAEDLSSGAPVAVKVLKPDLLAGGPFVERLRREARAITALDHPNIVRVHDVHVAPDLAFLVMERLEGESLGAFLRRGRFLGPTVVVRLALALLDALLCAHQSGLIHRDVKPDNIFLASVDGVAVLKLLDFGLVKAITDAAAPLTATGTVLGTWQYMPPEQARGLPLDARADVYAVGACMYYALTRKRPHQAVEMEPSMFALSEVPVRRLVELRPDLDPTLAAIVERALAKDRDARPTTEELRDALLPFADGDEPALLEGPDTERTPEAELPVQRATPPPTKGLTVPLAPAWASRGATQIMAGGRLAPVRGTARMAPVGRPPAAAPNRRLLAFLLVALVLFFVGALFGRTLLAR